MIVRKIESYELTLALDLIEQFNRPVALRPSEERLRSVHDSIISSGGCVVGAFSGEAMVGTCTINLCANLSWSARPYAIIENVIVSSGYRNQGIGKSLLAFAQEYGKQQGCYKIALMTGSKKPETHSFYESAGFSPSKTGFQVRFDA